MEIKAHYILIGAFTVLVGLAAFAFVLWTAKTDLDQRTETYLIYFEGGVAGLAPAGDVLYNGIKVGQVRDIAINPDDPSEVRVRIEVRAKTPVKEDSVAKLQPRGITGVSVVSISGGSAESPPLQAENDQKYPVIPSSQAEFERFLTGAPDLIEEGVALLNKLNMLVDSENRERLDSILVNVDTVSGNLAEASDSVPETLARIEEVATELAETSRQVRVISERIDSLLAQGETTLAQGETTLATIDSFVAEDLRRLSGNLDDLVGEVSAVVAEAKPGLKGFSNEGLRSLNIFIQEARQLVNTLQRLAQNVESSPRSLIFGNQVPEYETQ
jgi:phospholipid/cholesterol/gamma-HCH transport system substrate-binding protein